MRLSTLLLWAPLSLAGASPVQKTWKPDFDYTNLRASDEEFWEPLSRTQVSLEEAFALATGSDEKARLHGARFVGGEAFRWELEIWTSEAGQGKGFAVQVSGAEPKELARTPTAVDPEIWAALAETRVPLADAASIARSKLEDIKDHRTQSARFVGPADAHWELEIYGFDEKLGRPRRWLFHVSTTEPRVQRRLLQDRFPGEPLRRGYPTQLPSGLWVYDFQEGDGSLVSHESTVKIHYRLFLLDNTKVHDTWQDKAPETFALPKAPLKGMIEGMEGMRAGGRRKIAMPYTLAFGEPANRLVPARAMVVCDVEVLAVE